MRLSAPRFAPDLPVPVSFLHFTFFCVLWTNVIRLFSFWEGQDIIYDFRAGSRSEIRIE